MDIQTTLNQLFEHVDEDQIFSHILYLLSPSYIISSSTVSRAFADLLSRGSNKEIYEILQNHLPDGLTLFSSQDLDPTVVSSVSNIADSPRACAVISDRLQRIASSLPEKEINENQQETGIREDRGSDLREEEDLELRAQKYWQNVQTAETEHCRLEFDPILRLKHLNKEESQIGELTGKLDCRDRLVKVLMENERELISHGIKAQLEKERKKKPSHQTVQSHVNAHIAEKTRMEIGDFRRRSSEWRKPFYFVDNFGPGMLKILDGNKSDWGKITDDECDTLQEFIRSYRPDLVHKAREYDAEMASALFYGMLKTGFPLRDFATCETKIINIIKLFIEVNDEGRISQKTEPETVHRKNPCTLSITQSAKKLNEYIEKRNQNLKRTSKAKQRPRKKRRSSHHESSSAQQGPNGSDESRPHRSRTASGTAASTHDSSADTQTDPFSAVQVSIAATEESPHPPVSTGEDAISTTESTSEVDGSTDTTSSEATFLAHDSISGETPNHWTVGVGLDCNLRFQTVDHEPSIEQAASVLYAIQNQEACSQISQSLPQSFEALGQPIQQFQQSETTRSFDLYDQVPLAADLTQPLAERTVQDGAQSYVTCGSQGFEEIDFDTRQPTDPHGFDAISFDSQSNAWFANDSQGFEQVSFNAQNRIWQPAPWQGFECMSFNESHSAMSW